MEPGERIVLVGPSGSGKSTLLLALAGLLDPSGGGDAAGALRVDGRDPRAARDRSAVVLQDPDAQIVMGRAGDDVAFGLENRCVPTEAIWPRVDAALDAVALPGARARPTDTLSGGEKQRLALAGVLAMLPGLILLDEPTANLDADAAAAFRRVLRDALDRQGATLVMVEHRLDAALDLAGRIVALSDDGRVMADGPADRVLAERGDELAEAGVWVPGRPAPSAPPRDARAAEPRTMLLADQVTFTYPGAPRPALPRVDVRVGAGEALAVVGRNGAGKSTLAMLLAGLLRPTGGSVLAGEALTAGHAGEPVWRWPARVLAGRVGSVFQNPEHQFLAATCRDELLIGPRRAGLDDAAAQETADDLLERLGLASLARASPFTLSGGEQRRLSVATALVSAPAVLVADEPTFGQDRRTWSVLLGLLAELRNAGTAVVVMSHDREFVGALADRVFPLGAA